MSKALETVSSIMPRFSSETPQALQPGAARSAAPPTMQIPPAEDPLLHFLASCIMRHGNRQQATRTVSRMLLRLHAMTRAPPLPILRKAVLAMAPAVRCVSTKVAARMIITPLPLSEKQRTHYAVKWILEASDSKSGETLEERLANQIITIIGELEKLEELDPTDERYVPLLQASALRKKFEVHRTALMNRGNVRVSRRT